ncbi:hypothetical protein GGR53DRAFT_11640 [Hypoxylon sp. FL1150]|nr:hypothetical protein GGR53DRAFT_11640 [Hypoxylon sp. FL1150]
MMWLAIHVLWSWSRPPGTSHCILILWKSPTLSGQIGPSTVLPMSPRSWAPTRQRAGSLWLAYHVPRITPPPVAWRRQRLPTSSQTIYGADLIYCHDTLEAALGRETPSPVVVYHGLTVTGGGTGLPGIGCEQSLDTMNMAQETGLKTGFRDFCQITTRSQRSLCPGYQSHAEVPIVPISQALDIGRTRRRDGFFPLYLDLGSTDDLLTLHYLASPPAGDGLELVSIRSLEQITCPLGSYHSSPMGEHPKIAYR